jgi:citrate synthase
VNEYPTSIGTADATSIRLLGHDLAGELLGTVSFGELSFWLVAMRRPSPGELRVFEAVLVALADHGLTPTVIAARMTLTGAPESLQGAVAAGVLGGGSRYLGVTEDCGRFLADALEASPGPLPGPDDHAAWDDLAAAAVTRRRAAGGFVPGLGHPIHKETDPRTPVMIRLASTHGVLGPHLRLFEAVGRVHPAIVGRRLPMNGAGVCGAVLADLGMPIDMLRGFALLARTAGLLGHLAEERRNPIGQRLYDDVDAATVYRPPPDTPQPT